MRRVVVTGMGIVSSIGNNTQEVVGALRQGISGLQFVPEMQALGYRCQVAGLVKGLQLEGIAKHTFQRMSNVARYAVVATLEALEDAKITPEDLNNRRTGAVVGSALGGVNQAALARRRPLSQKSPACLGPMGMVEVMSSAAALNLAAWLGIKGRCYAVASACATGIDNIGHGFELIRHDLIDLCICGGAEEHGLANSWGFFDATNGMPTDFNERPDAACRPYDRDRQGMVLSEGAGVLVLEAIEHAERRGARMYGEVLSYSSANDGNNIFEPTGCGLRSCLEEVLTAAGDTCPVRIDYVNTHGTGTKLGDAVEVRVMKEIFRTSSPLVSSTKGLTGHALGAAGAQEAILTLLMLHNGFVVPTANLEHVPPECTGVCHVRAWQDIPLQTAMTFNAGLGGTNAALVFKRL
jgi:3-oxoacyl-[acyl-carrier-protein] synthase-1